ncbi:MAG: type II toxin-antitoxin system HicA family toxin [Acidobacteriota bacterium]
MPKLPCPTGEEMVAFLQSQGFVVARIRGSHHVMHNGILRTTVPVHGHDNLRIGTLRAILRDVEISPNEFAILWNKR